MTYVDRKMLMQRIRILRESYRLGSDEETARMLCTLPDVPEKFKDFAREFLKELGAVDAPVLDPDISPTEQEKVSTISIPWKSPGIWMETDSAINWDEDDDGY